MTSFTCGDCWLIFSQPEPSIEFSATPHYCLRQLGLIEGKHHHGGETYRLFRDAIERLSAVTYQNDNFYDPMRSEHCQVSFGFLSYRLPLNTDSSRAWRFYMDPLFFEICQATASALAFDLATYRKLDAATRRLYLLLKKLFWKRTSSMQFDVRHLAVNVLGFSAAQGTWKLKQKLAICVEKLVVQGILSLPTEESVKQLFHKLHKGHYSIVLHRGPHFDRAAAAPRRMIDTPLQELLQLVGFEPAVIARILNTYPPKMITEWADITLAARERNGETFFKKSAQAFFIDNIRHAAAGTRTPPDWWRELRRKEDEHRRRRTAGSSDEALDQYLETEARDAFESVMQSIFQKLVEDGKDESEARGRARQIARSNLRSRFLREHPEYRSAETISTPVDRDTDE